MKETISIKLFNTLNQGKEKLKQASLSRVRRFVESQRMNDESFMNKSGESDIYYTVFGWMLSYVLGIQPDPKKTALYLAKQDAQSMDLIHYAAYMRCRIIQNLFEGGKIKLLLTSLSKTPIRPLTGFSALPHNDPYAPYTQFIWLSLLEDTRNPVIDKDESLSSLADYHITGGGYSNIKDSITATTNATAAALAVTGQLNGYTDNENIDYLWSIQKESGGYAATESAPLPDLLSTATALFMLQCYGRKPKISPVDFIEAHWLENGGFSATLLEDCSDVEYTFYGLLALGTI